MTRIIQLALLAIIALGTVYNATINADTNSTLHNIDRNLVVAINSHR